MAGHSLARVTSLLAEVRPGDSHQLSARATGPWREADSGWSQLCGTLAVVTAGHAFDYLERHDSAIQERRQSAQTSFGIHKEVFDRMMCPEDQAARRWIIQNPAVPTAEDEPRQDWLHTANDLLDEAPPGWEVERPPARAHLKRVLNTFGFLEFVHRHYWSMEKGLVEWLSPPVAKVWERIGPLVKDEALRRDEPDYCLAARRFGQSCVAWR